MQPKKRFLAIHGVVLNLFSIGRIYYATATSGSYVRGRSPRGTPRSCPDAFRNATTGPTYVTALVDLTAPRARRKTPLLLLRMGGVSHGTALTIWQVVFRCVRNSGRL